MGSSWGSRWGIVNVMVLERNREWNGGNTIAGMIDEDEGGKSVVTRFVFQCGHSMKA